MAKKSQKTRVVVLDTHAIIHRAYHALPDFATSSGEPTGALYGVSLMLMNIITELKPDFIVACYDLPGGTFRNDIDENYKANRGEANTDLISQIERSRDILKAFSIPLFEKKGYEADDLLGTIAEKLKKDKNMEIIIASGDMDTLQLVDGDQVKVYTLKKGVKETIIYNEDAVVERFGFVPTLLPDYKGFRGDPSDNIVGIKGVGDKTATTLISNFGSIDQIYKKLKKDEQAFLDIKITPRIIGLLKDGEEDAVFSRTLAEIIRDVPITFDLPATHWREAVQPEDIVNLFAELEFRNLTKKARDFFDIHSVEQTEVEEVGSEDLKEVAIALWLIDSEKTDANLDDILAHTKEKIFQKAKEKIFEELKTLGLQDLFDNMEKPLIPVVSEMQENGIKLDKKYLENLSKKYHKSFDDIQAKIFKISGEEFNVRSPQQLSTILFEKLELPTKGVKKGASGGYSTNIKVLEKLEGEHEIIPLIMEFRELSKLLSTYIDVLPGLVAADGRIHGEFLQNGTSTGRFSSNNPNLQNIPTRSELGRAIRGAFVAESGKTLVSLDYSQIELRLTAILSEDKYMINVFKEGDDIHSAVAAKVFGVEEKDVTSDMRRRAKVINFGIIYGMGVSSLQKNLGSDRKTAQKFYDDYFENFPTIKAYLESTKEYARKHGFTETMFGRRRNFASINSKTPFVRAMAERTATNAPIQGAGADLVKIAMIKVDEYLTEKKVKKSAKLILQVHDELVYEVENDFVEEFSKKAESIMKNVFEDSFIKFKSEVPLEVHYSKGSSWYDLK